MVFNANLKKTKLNKTSMQVWQLSREVGRNKRKVKLQIVLGVSGFQQWRTHTETTPEYSISSVDLKIQRGTVCFAYK